jgi:uncharacterized SAM-binding protein YcdF (DUF218 family)
VTSIDPLLATADAPPTEPLDAPVPDPTPVGGGRVVRPRRRRRWARRVTLGIVALLAGYYLITLWQVHRTGRSDERHPVDAIVVMGAAQYDGRPSPILAARLDHVVGLWEDGAAPLVVVTGGKQEGDRYTEAEASADYLVDHGVPIGSIVLENDAHNSYDSLAGVRRLLAERGVDDVVLVSDPYHMLRAKLTAEELGLDVAVSATRTSPVQGFAERRRELKEAAGVALGRLIGFDRLLSLTG